MVKYCKTLISELDREYYTTAYQYMCPERKAKVDSFKVELMKCQTLAGEYIARKLIAEAWNLDTTKLSILPDSKGKLYAEGHPHIHLSISHSGGTIAVAVSDEPIGIDAEEIRPLKLKLASRFCLDEEIEYIFGHMPTEEELCSTGEGDTLKRFLEIWTLKEAYFKCIGTGITDLKSINVLGGDIKKTDLSDENAVVNIVTL